MSIIISKKLITLQSKSLVLDGFTDGFYQTIKGKNYTYYLQFIPKIETEGIVLISLYEGFTIGGTSGKESICHAGDAGDADLIPGSGRSPGVGNDNPLQYSFLENSVYRRAWQAI